MDSDFECYIYRVASNTIEKDFFQLWILDKFLLKNNDNLNQGKKNFFDQWHFKHPTMDMYHPTSFTCLLNDVNLYIYKYKDEHELPKDIALFDMDYQRINYKNLLAQYIFNKNKIDDTEWSDFKNFELIYHDGNESYVYFEIHDDMYCIKMYTS